MRATAASGLHGVDIKFAPMKKELRFLVQTVQACAVGRADRDREVKRRSWRPSNTSAAYSPPRPVALRTGELTKLQYRAAIAQAHADPARPLSVTRYARNPRIVRSCSDLGIAGELGEGIKRIFNEMRARGNPRHSPESRPEGTRLPSTCRETSQYRTGRRTGGYQTAHCDPPSSRPARAQPRCLGL